VESNKQCNLSFRASRITGRSPAQQFVQAYDLLIKGEKLMYARVVTVQAQPGKTEEAIAIFRNSVIPAAKQQKGFISLMLLTD
jgi:hypothetical protein